MLKYEGSNVSIFRDTNSCSVYVTAYAYDTIHMHEVMMYGKDFVELLNMMNLLIEQVTKHCDLATGRGRGGDGDGGCGDGWGWGRKSTPMQVSSIRQ
jgi:hypothetical protein